jgi:hypothetical protein
MNLRSVRSVFTEKSSVGNLWIAEERFCHALEDRDRGLVQSMTLDEIKKIKVYGETCIPYGTYEIKLLKSPHFGKDMPYLQNVPGFVGIMIHPGNLPKDTFGCILVGYGADTDRVNDSQHAFKDLMAMFMLARDEKHFIEIIKEGEVSLPETAKMENPL